jgi:nitrogen fixation/metabolism regulation signal transduction histidine kinase
MVFKNFRFQVIMRVIILVVSITLLAWCLVYEFYLRSVYLAGAVIVLVGELIWYIDRFNRDIKTFMVSLLQRDFTTHYQSTGKSKSFDELYTMLNRISKAFETINAEKEVQFRYLEMLVEHLRVGILSLDQNGKITLVNQAFKDLLHKNILTSLKSFESFDQSFVKVIQEIQTGETQLLKLRVENEVLQLSIHASEFKLQDKYYKLISMQNIRDELDAREMEAWQKLIRVLTHEIMNSVSPVISLSSTLHGLVNQNSAGINRTDMELFNTLNKGLEAIKIRSEGLYNFTQSYRKLTGIPKLSLKQVNVKDILSRVQVLMQNTMNEKGIDLKVSLIDAALNVDPDLFEHVLINLLLNAIEAVSETNDPRIEISSSFDESGSVVIRVADNGEGMDEATSERIFIPFFTTRKNGSGIGLAITKQILQLHRADIHFTTARGKGTEFFIVL